MFNNKSINRTIDFFSDSAKWHKPAFFMSCCVLLIYLFPTLFLQEDAIIKVRDSLDGCFVFRNIIAQSGVLFNFSVDAKVDNMMNGISLTSMPSVLNIPTWLFYFFKPLTAILINFVLVHIIAFIGMYMMLKNHIIKREEDLYIVSIVALCFSVLPFFYSFGLCSAGIPLLFNSLFNLSKYKGRLSDYLIIFIFPFYSALVLVGVFFLIGFSLFFIVISVKDKKINYPLGVSLFLVGVIYLIVEYRLVYSLLIDSDFVSHRTELCNASIYTWDECLESMFRSFMYGFWQAPSLQYYYVLFVIPLGIIAGILKKEYTLLKLFLLILMCLLFFSFMHGFWYWKGLEPLREKMHVFKSFDWRRFYFLQAPFLYILFAIGLLMISKVKWGKYLVVLIFMLQLRHILLYYENFEFNLNVKKALGYKTEGYYSYKEFYGEKLFAQIKKDIKRPQQDYRVVCVGLHPAIANYSGFYTLDSYQDNYPLAYKHQFRKIMEKELEKADNIKFYFDCWASICYFMPAELNKDADGNVSYYKSTTMKIQNLEMNTEAFKSMGGEYLLSAVEIINFKDNNLTFIKEYNHDDSAWKIYLYKAL